MSCLSCKLPTFDESVLRLHVVLRVLLTSRKKEYESYTREIMYKKYVQDTVQYHKKKWGKKIKNKNNACVFYLFEPKLWVRLSQDVLARGGDVAAASEVECLEVRTSSCYFGHTGVSDVVAV